MATTNLTGPIRDAAQNLLPETEYQIIPDVPLYGQGIHAVAGKTVSGTTAATTALIAPVTLDQGRYFLRYRVNGQWVEARLTLNAADMTIGAALDPLLEVTSSIAQDAQAAQVAAETARNEAVAAAASVGFTADSVTEFTNKTINAGGNTLQGADGVRRHDLKTFAALAALTPAQAPDGSMAVVDGIGTYEAVSGGGDLDYTSGGGTMWNIVRAHDGFINVKQCGADGTVANDTAAFRLAGSIGGKIYVNAGAWQVNDEIPTTVANTDWYFDLNSTVTMTVVNKRMFTSDQVNNVRYHGPRLRGYGITDTASVVNADTFTSTGDAIGIVCERATGFQVHSPDLTDFKNACIVASYCSQVIVSGGQCLNTNANAADTDIEGTAGSTQQFGVLIWAQSYAHETIQDPRYGGSQAALDVNLTPHGNQDILIENVTVGEGSIGVSVFPGYANTTITGTRLKGRMAQHLVYVFPDDDLSILDTKGGPNGNLVKVNNNSTNIAKHIRGLVVENVVDTGEESPEGAAAVILETNDKGQGADVRGEARFFFLSPRVSNIQSVNRSRAVFIAECCRDLDLDGLSIRDTETGVPSAAIELVNCTGRIGGGSVTNAFFNVLDITPAINGHIFVNGVRAQNWGATGSGNGYFLSADKAQDAFPWTSEIGASVDTIFRTSAGRTYIVTAVSGGTGVGKTGTTEPTSETTGITDGDLTLDFIATTGDYFHGHVSVVGNNLSITKSGVSTRLFILNDTDVRLSWYDNDELSTVGTLAQTYTAAQMVRHRHTQVIETTADVVLPSRAATWSWVNGAGYAVPNNSVDGYVCKSAKLIEEGTGTTTNTEYLLVEMNVRSATQVRGMFSQNASTSTSVLAAGSKFECVFEKGFS